MTALNELFDQNKNIDTRVRGILDAIQQFSFASFLQFWMEVLRESYDTQKYLQRRGLSLENCSHKMNASIAFLVNDRDALVKQSIKTAIKISEKQKISIEERRVRRKKNMPGEHAKDLGLSAVKEIKRCMLVAMDRFWSKAEKRFSEIRMLNEVFGFLNPHALLRSENIEKDMNKFKNIYADDVNFSELTYEIARFNKLVQSRGTAFQSDARALDVVQWLTKYRLCESTPYLFLCLTLYLTVAVSIASCKRSFSKLKLIKCYLRLIVGESKLSALAILSIESDFI